MRDWNQEMEVSLSSAGGDLLPWGPIWHGGGGEMVGVMSRRSPGLGFGFVENGTFLSKGKSRAVSFGLSGPKGPGEGSLRHMGNI